MYFNTYVAMVYRHRSCELCCADCNRSAGSENRIVIDKIVIGNQLIDNSLITCKHFVDKCVLSFRFLIINVKRFVLKFRNS